MSKNFSAQQMQIMRQFEIFHQHVHFFEFEINNLQNYSIEIIFYQSNQFVVSQKNQSNFYKNNQFLNSKFNQRFSLQRMYDWFSSNKCFYYYRKNHVFKRQCSNFQNNMFNNQIQIYEKKIYLKFFRDETFHVRIWIDRNQRDCVRIFEKFNEIIFFLRRFLFNLMKFNN